MDNDETRLTAQLALAQELVEHLQNGDEEGARLIIQQLRFPYERELFEELGKLTRELHEALQSFRGDSRLVEITQDEIPDAKERLSYVVTMTEQATHRTLNAVDEGLPIAERVHDNAVRLSERWGRFRRRELSLDEFREFAHELDAFFTATGQETERLRSLMSEIMMAQDFQDLTGQIIGRVIRLVQDVEENLVGLIRLSSGRMEGAVAKPAEPSVEKAEEPHPRAGVGPAVPNTSDDLGDVVSGQDDVDALLSSLGF
ncbi:chemotaxis protein CheZ [Marichromatium purpuratum 984]|uniref:Protein phosphatase CheZ n=1 Tax=Marichromatium purpuratum 984 TaxID=765910 RepID=W0DYW5_MARPU|nr:protein phosphatase CheZ [Marichromatium purpuratum]AHF03647.1 chemotaxis protein CheZ [Marichromatium purpuratum 984]